MRRFAFLMLAVLASHVSARDGEGMLDVIRVPHEGRPALVSPGGSFEILVSAKADSVLVGERSVTVQWRSAPGGAFTGELQAPQDLAPGVYALKVMADGKEDANLRCVHVLKTFPDSYTVAYMSDTLVGAAGSLEDLADAALEANVNKVALVLLTGNLTSDGQPGQFRALLRGLRAFEAPVFVSPGARDLRADAYSRFFGDTSYAFRYGKDGYMAIDTSRHGIGESLDNAPGRLQIQRRAIKASRWSIGFTHRYDAMDMRNQIVLYVDNPLDFLVSGQSTPDTPDAITTSPWGPTRIATASPLRGRGMTLFTVSSQGVTPTASTR